MNKTVKFLSLFFLLFVGINLTWAQGLLDMLGGVDPENPATWFYVNLNARVSNPGCGTTTPGKVYLIATDASDERTPQNPWITGDKPTNPYSEETQFTEYDRWRDGFNKGKDDAKAGYEEKAYEFYWNDSEESLAIWHWAIDGYDTAWDWYKSGHYLNASNPTGVPDNSSAWGTTASLKGYSLIYAPGFDDVMGMSAYAYFFGKAAENDGWYFSGWSFTEGESDLGGVVGTADSLQFRILPSSNPEESNIINEYVYATFRPVMVSNYKVNGLINTSVSTSTTITFDVVGERVSTSDFTASVPEANFSATITSCENNKVTVTVTYSGSSDGEFRGNVTLASKSGCSQLTAPVYARVGANADKEATLYDGKTPTSTSGTLTAMIAAANNTDKIVVLNKNIEAATTINAKVTINFNGYNIANTLTVSGGEVTVTYSKYAGGANALSVTGGKAILNGGEFASLTVGANGIVEQNGAIFTGASTNSGTLITTEGRFEAGLTSSGTLTINGGLFEGATAITISGGTANINKATIAGDTYGIEATGGTTNITSKLVSVNGGTNAVKQSSTGIVNLTNGKFVGNTAPLAGTINLQAGYFKVDGEHLGIAVPTGKKVLNVLAGTEFAEGYRYFVGDDASSVGVCRIGTTSYFTLEDALAYANNTGATVTIIMTNDYTLPAGYYTLPANATLIVPMDNEQEVGYNIIHRVSNNSVSATPYVQPTEFRRLTFAKGVNIDVHGTIELTGTQRASDDAYATLPHGPYGLLVMDEGSHMTLQNGSRLRAWGYMIGKGETDVRRGATVQEQFQMGDWKGGGVSFSMLAAADTRVFPITQYYIQNIESPVKYHPGAVLTTTTSVSANFGSIGVTAMANDIAIVGVSGVHTAMFLMDQEADAENTWVRKWYDAEHDVQTYEVNSGAHLGSMVLDLGKLGTQPLVMNSGYFVLPITNNMKIHLLSGMMDFTQTTSLLPGAEVEVDKESVIKIVNNDDPSVFSGSLYIYDADDWGKANGKGDAGTLYTKVVPYSPSFGGKPNIRTETDKPADAKINVHGSFDTGEGAVYTTPSGANIFSTNTDAGSFIFTLQAPASTSDVYQYINGSGYTSVAATSAKLKNGNGEYVSTETAQNNQAYMYMDNEWKTSTGSEAHMVYFDCFTAQVNMVAYATDVSTKANNIAIYHAPDNIAECLAIMSGMSVDAATAQGYRSNDGFMSTVRPQIEAMRDAGYDLGAAVEHIYIKPQEWVEINGTAHIQLDFDQDDVDALEALYDAGNYAEAVQGYMDYIEARAYNPYLVGVDGNEDHTYSDAAGAGRLFILMNKGCQWWEVEKKDNLYHCIHPDNDTYYYWDENAEEWAEKKFTITWKNWDGNPVYTANEDGDPTNTYFVTYGTMAEFLGTNPTREKTIDYTYDFTGWTPALGPVTSDVTYTATYEQKERKYTIIFCQEGGVEIERQFLKHNDVPVCENTPTKIGHTLVWSPAIAAVTGDATYTATWLEEPPTEYEVTFFDYNGTTELQKGNVAVGVVPTPPANPTGKPATTEFTYVFDHWSPALEEVSATSIKSYTAVYREVAKTYTVIFQNEDGSEIERHEYTYGATPVCSAVPTKENTAQYTYSFAWAPQIETVRSAATYRAVFTPTTNKYTVTVKSNPSGACSSTGAGLYDYNTSATITLTVNDGYTFTGWSDGQEGTNTTRTINVTEDKELVANFTVADPDYTITWNNEAGSLIYSMGQKANTATIYTGAIPTKDATAAKTYTFYGWSTAANGGGTIYKNGMTPKATANAAYFAYFNETDRTYTIAWANEAGTANIEVDYEQPYGAAIAYNSATPTKQATAQYTYTFDGWSTSVGGTAADVPATVTGDATFYAHFASTTKTYTITFLRDDGSLIDREDVAYGTTPTHADPTKPATAEYTYEFTGWDRAFEAVTGLATYTASFSSTPIVVGEDLEIGTSDVIELIEPTTKENLIITSDGTSSGQLIGAEYLTLTGNAYFDLAIDAQAGTWYAVAVPWQVETSTGLSTDNGQLIIGANCRVMYHDGERRALNGKDAVGADKNEWQDVHNGETLQPGKLYMIRLNSSASKIRFQCKPSTSLINTDVNVVLFDSQTATDANWNGIANPTTFYAWLNANSETYDHPHFAQKYIPGEERYEAFDMSANSLVVGQPVFVQATAAGSVVVANQNNKPDYAPQRRQASAVSNQYYNLQVAMDGQVSDQLYILAQEDKEDKYIIGADLAKSGVSKIVPQMWVNRYNTKLCVNTEAFNDDIAQYPLGIFAPKDGEYEIYIASAANDDTNLYLTYDGTVVWNLSYGAFTAYLPAGTDNHYGLRIVAKAPQVVTDMDEARVGDNTDNARKVLIDNHIYIIRAGEVYTIGGQKVQ